MAKIITTVLLILISFYTFAEGADQTGSNQGLSNITVLYADVLDANNETIVWNGNGDVTVLDPAGQEVFPNAGTFIPTSNGSYEVHLESNQFDGPITAPTLFYDWELTVIDDQEVPIPGRIWSLHWRLTSGTFEQSGATNMSMYALLPGGSTDHETVVEVRYDGMSGSVYDTFANDRGPRDGVSGPNLWASTLTEANGAFAIDGQFPLYLLPPQKASYSFITPAGTSLSLDACEFGVDTDVEGVALVLCDLDGDGLDGSITDLDDMRIVHHVAPGLNTFVFNGKDITGQTIPPGQYNCRAIVTVGTFHHVGIDMETSYPGLRMFQVNSNGSRTPLSMFWDDSKVQWDGDGVPRTVSMPTCGTSPVSPPGTGILSGEYTNPAQPYSDTCPSGNARAWGDFSGSSKGNSALLDSYSWVASDQADAALQIQQACTPSDIFDDSFEGVGEEE